MIVNPVLVGIFGTLFVEMSLYIIKNYIIKMRSKKNNETIKNKTF